MGNCCGGKPNDQEFVNNLNKDSQQESIMTFIQDDREVGGLSGADKVALIVRI